jgi:hypothetical protein
LALMILFFEGQSPARSRVARQPSYRLLLPARAGVIMTRPGPAAGRVSHCRVPPRVTSYRCSAPWRSHADRRARGARPAGPRAGRVRHPHAPDTMRR